MTINLEQIYAGLKAWRKERGITAQSQKDGYLVNIMEEFGELATALREYERFSKPSYPYPKNKKYAEHGIIDALCDISVFTINAGADIPCAKKDLETHTGQLKASFAMLVEACAIFAQDKEYSTVDYIAEIKAFEYHIFFNDILHICACLAYNYGFNFEIAMLETIKEISSRTGSYDKNAKKWVKDKSDEARAKWHQANYELARIKQ